MPMIDCILIQQLTGTLKTCYFLCYPPSLQVKGNDCYSVYIWCHDFSLCEYQVIVIMSN